MLNPIWLNTFKTLVELGHFTRTAEALNMTQPGVSQHINKLESACGYPLLTRFNKQFELTIHGRKVYQYALELIEKESELLIDLGKDEPFLGSCRIGCSGTFAWLIYPELLSLQAQHSQLSIELEASPNDRIFEQILSGGLDVGLVTKPPNPHYFDSRVIGSESLVFVVPTSVNTTIPFEKLLPEIGVIRHPDLDHYFQTYVDQSGSPQLSKLNLDTISTKGYINQIHQILVPIAKGIGFTVIPRCCVNLFLERDKLQVLDIAENVKDPVYLVSKRHSELARRYDRVVKVIEETLVQC
ncbi:MULTISPECIES: LysR family transcriptional regulator [Vibrio]|uniref:LysR family transcriptional regulator n=2 Tax=Vibrio TaxID=662 RepID=A0A7X4LHA5_9VIBR|nr:MULTISPECIES: LysR family transcriptional regulator [Vibrio]MBF9003200.1 LysR family transcriptional regulator [Vibrio nitrifigilis]MZI91924.1 LysR family transcriptional regulator [Vibrio eleionomae]